MPFHVSAPSAPPASLHLLLPASVRPYKWTEHELHGAGCAVCRGVCNCSICLDKQGLGAHKAFLTAFTREGGCARAWLAQRGLLCEGAAPAPLPRRKNFAKRPKILGKKQTAGAEQKIKHKKHASKMEEEEGRSRGRWMIDASAAACKKFERRWAMERGVRAEQVRLGKRRWFVGESPPPRAAKRRAIHNTVDAPVETIDLTLDDDKTEDDQAPDSLFDEKIVDDNGRVADDDNIADADDKTEDDDAETEDDDAPDSLFDEKAADDAAPASPDSLFDGSGTFTPVAPAPTPLAAPTQLSLVRSDSYADALRVETELVLVASPSAPASPPKLAQPPREAQMLFRDPFTPAPASPADAAFSSVHGARSSGDGARSSGDVTIASGDVALSSCAASVSPPDAAVSPTAPKPPPTFAKAASAMFIPRSKATKRKRDADEGEGEKRLESVKSSVGVLVALGRPGEQEARAKRLREDEPDEPPAKRAALSKDPRAESTDANSTVVEGLPAPEPTLDKRTAGSTSVVQGLPTPKPTLDKRASAAAAPAPSMADALAQAMRTAYSGGASSSSAAAPDSSSSARSCAPMKPSRPASSPDAPKSPAASSSRTQASAISSRGEKDPPPSGAALALAAAMASARGKPTVLAEAAHRAVAAKASGSTAAPASISHLAVALKAPRAKPSSSAASREEPGPAPSMATALAAAYKKAYSHSSGAVARNPSPVSTLRSSPTPEPVRDPSPPPPPPLPTSKQSSPARPRGQLSYSPATTVRASVATSKSIQGPGKSLNDELSKFISAIGDDDKDDESTPELLPSELANPSEGSSRTGPVSPVVVPRMAKDDDSDSDALPTRRPFVPRNPRQFVGMPLRFVPAKKRPRARPSKKVEAVDDVDDDYKSDSDGDDFGLARRRKKTKLWQASMSQQTTTLGLAEPIIVLDDSEDEDFRPPGAAAKGKAKGKTKPLAPAGKGKSKPRKLNALPLSTFISYSYTPPPPEPEPEPEPAAAEPVFVPDDDTAAAPPEPEVWLVAAMTPPREDALLAGSPDLGFTRTVADHWFASMAVIRDVAVKGDLQLPLAGPCETPKNEHDVVRREAGRCCGADAAAKLHALQSWDQDFSIFLRGTLAVERVHAVERHYPQPHAGLLLRWRGGEERSELGPMGEGKCELPHGFAQVVVPREVLPDYCDVPRHVHVVGLHAADAPRVVAQDDRHGIYYLEGDERGKTSKLGQAWLIVNGAESGTRRHAARVPHAKRQLYQAATPRKDEQDICGVDVKAHRNFELLQARRKKGFEMQRAHLVEIQHPQRRSRYIQNVFNTRSRAACRTRALMAALRYEAGLAVKKGPSISTSNVTKVPARSRMSFVRRKSLSEYKRKCAQRCGVLSATSRQRADTWATANFCSTDVPLAMVNIPLSRSSGSNAMEVMAACGQGGVRGLKM
ncbi:hypothetical protein AURDEDRAFT_155058 [Auricularia subglabra TFB-10046 SS5]|uniref:Zinc-finger domain-containing protein n=1 Tax=Auricularia subglabra (strain TFB-10046 / SS5) TaxID=717982 RepID=J0WR51_AURST|nr:hypothetical protein AURDEDRAFT_155058 [Auricularia subglabra TFB-10046 SS5]